MRRFVSLVAAVLALGAFALGAFTLIVAQEDPDRAGDGGACATPGATPLASPLASPAASPVASLVASPCPEVGTPVGAQASGDTVTVEMVDIAFAPAQFSVPANTPVQVALPNRGRAVHNFSIDQLGIKVDVPPGQAGQTTINAPTGTYEYYCDEPGHAEAGMVGTLTIP